MLSDNTMSETDQTAWIDLRRNNTLTNDPCRLCGERCDPCGLDFFLGETEALVCDNCARKHAPELCDLIRLQGRNIELTGTRGHMTRNLSLDHFVGVCLLCLKAGTLTHIRGMGFFYCETDRVYWDQSCDRIFFQAQCDYDKDESDRNELLLDGYIYIEDQVNQAFDVIRAAQRTVIRCETGFHNLSWKHPKGSQVESDFPF